MAIVTDTFTSYDAVGIREDLIDVITNIDPIDTFVTSNTGSGRATNRYHEWQTDILAAAAENAVIEGDQASNTAITATVRKGNYCQILRKVFQVTDSEIAMNTAGRASELSYQLQKNLKELARDIEYCLLINSASASGATGTARKSLGINGWISDNVTSSSASAAEALTETKLNDNLALIWADGGRPTTVLCPAFQKRQIDAFSTNTRDIQAESKTLVRAVDMYKSSFGPLSVRLHHQMNTTLDTRVVVLGDMSLWKKAWLRPIKVMELARVSSSERRMIEAELTLESRQEKGSGTI